MNFFLKKFTKFNFIRFIRFIRFKLHKLQPYSSFLAFARDSSAFGLRMTGREVSVKDSSAFGLRMTLFFCYPEQRRRIVTLSKVEGSLDLFQNLFRNPFRNFILLFLILPIFSLNPLVMVIQIRN